MGLFGKLFEKKECDFCGGEIGMLGNRKLEDGNMCKECAKKLSPWFDDRRHSTVEQIQQQLEMREANKQAVAAFRDTTVLGKSTHRIYIDENARKFMVCREKERGDNPDVFDFSQVTSVIVDIDEDRDEKFQTDGDGDRRSYYPPRYTYHYDIRVIIYLNHPYVDDIRFDINASRISTTLLGQAVPENMKPNPRSVKEFMDCEQIAMKIKGILEGGNFQQGFGGQPQGFGGQPQGFAGQQQGFGGAAAGFGAAAGMAGAAGGFGGAPQQAPQQAPQAPAGGAWQCACGNMATGKFCPECGGRRPANEFRCDKCGWRPAPGTTPPRFCPECGDPFDENDFC